MVVKSRERRRSVRNDLKVADEGVCDKDGGSVGGWFGGGSRLVEAFKEVLLADWCSQTTPPDVTRRPIPKLVTRSIRQ